MKIDTRKPGLEIWYREPLILYLQKQKFGFPVVVIEASDGRRLAPPATYADYDKLPERGWTRVGETK